MIRKSVCIIGYGHLAFRVKLLAEKKGWKAVCVSAASFVSKEEAELSFDQTLDILRDLNLKSFSMVFLLDDKDERNLELMIGIMSLDKDIPITAALFNENITPHLRVAHPKLHIFNPAKIAAPAFVEALYVPLERTLNYEPSKAIKELPYKQSDNLIKWLLGGFIAIIILAGVYFHFALKISLLDSFYFVVVTVATVGYGDINLLNADALSKVIDILLIISSTVFIWMIFSLTINGIIKKRAQLFLGHKKYSYTNHVVVCGLGRLGYFIVEELLRRGEKIIIVELNQDSPHIEYFRRHGAEIYIGDARLPRVLQDIGVEKAKALISVINDDFANLEIGLNARSFEASLRLILRIFDETMGKKIKESLDIHLTLSMSAIADDTLLSSLE